MTGPLTGRCYCGAVRLRAASPPITVVHCHCADCRRWTGAAFGTFAAFPETRVSLSPDPGPVSHAPGVDRWHCAACGSPLMARFSYLPGQVYLPIGVLDDADRLVPERHAHADARLHWLHLDDGLPRDAGSARDSLNDGLRS